MAGKTETVHLLQQQDYQFKMQFGGGTAPDWLADEPPLGQGAGPSPVQTQSVGAGIPITVRVLDAGGAVAK